MRLGIGSLIYLTGRAALRVLLMAQTIQGTIMAVQAVKLSPDVWALK